MEKQQKMLFHQKLVKYWLIARHIINSVKMIVNNLNESRQIIKIQNKEYYLDNSIGERAMLSFIKSSLILMKNFMS